MGKKVLRSRFFTEKEVKDFRRLAKVYNYKGVSIESDLFVDETCETNVVKMSIPFNYITGNDERNLGNIARLTHSKRITIPSKNKVIVEYRKYI